MSEQNPMRTSATNAIPLAVDLCDGSRLIGTFVSMAQYLDDRNDCPIKNNSQTVRTLTIISDTIGVVGVDARHIVRIGKSPDQTTEVKSPADVSTYITTLMEERNNA